MSYATSRQDKADRMLFEIGTGVKPESLARADAEWVEG
jgi:hypothetical protein